MYKCIPNLLHKKGVHVTNMYVYSAQANLFSKQAQNKFHTHYESIKSIAVKLITEHTFCNILGNLYIIEDR